MNIVKFVCAKINDVSISSFKRILKNLISGRNYSDTIPHQVQEGVHGLEGVEQQHVVVEHLGQHLLLRPEEVAGLGGVGAQKDHGQTE